MAVTDATSVDEITNEEVIDSRELIELRETVQAWLGDEDHDPDEYDEVDARAIVAAVDEFESAGVADWQYGEAFIRDDYFEEHARQLAEDIGAIADDAGWPMSYIDWDAAAEALRMDYTAVEVNGVTFWAR